MLTFKETLDFLAINKLVETDFKLRKFWLGNVLVQQGFRNPLELCVQFKSEPNESSMSYYDSWGLYGWNKKTGTSEPTLWGLCFQKEFLELFGQRDFGSCAGEEILVLQSRKGFFYALTNSEQKDWICPAQLCSQWEEK